MVGKCSEDSLTFPSDWEGSRILTPEGKLSEAPVAGMTGLLSGFQASVNGEAL